jgi:hypothetical protein
MVGRGLLTPIKVAEVFRPPNGRRGLQTPIKVCRRLPLYTLNFTFSRFLSFVSSYLCGEKIELVVEQARAVNHKSTKKVRGNL